MKLFYLHTEGIPIQRDGFGKNTKGFISHKQHQYIMFSSGSKRLGITFLSASHSGDRQNGVQKLIFLQPWAYKPS